MAFANDKLFDDICIISHKQQQSIEEFSGVSELHSFIHLTEICFHSFFPLLPLRKWGNAQKFSKRA